MDYFKSSFKFELNGIEVNAIQFGNGSYHFYPVYTPEFVLDVKDGALLSTEEGMRTYVVGTLRSYCKEYGDDYEEALLRAKKNGHETVWINPRGSIICTGVHPDNGKVFINVEPGIKVRLEGKLYIIEPAANQNLRLQPIEEATHPGE